MKTKFLTVAALFAASVFAANAGEVPSENNKTKKSVKEIVTGHFKFYGFVRNYFAFDTRESTAGTGDLFYYLPKDVEKKDGTDINAVPSFRFLSITSRLGVDVSGYKLGNAEFGAKIETDFYYGLSGKGTAKTYFPNAASVSGTAQLRLRQAYLTIGWKDLKLNSKETASVSLKIGQAWHPITADQPAVFSLETGAPFNPFSRTPQVTMDANLGSHWTITGSLLWQMQYLSTGPNGGSADYIKYSCTPEVYAGLTFKTKSGVLMRLGATALSIKPRALGVTPLLDEEGNVVMDGTDPKMRTVKVSDRITTVSPYFYFQYTDKNHPLQIKAKTVYGSAGEHIGLMSGYGITAKHEEAGDDGHYDYTPLHSSSTWASISYGKKWQFTLMGGYVKNLGTDKPLAPETKKEMASDNVTVDCTYDHYSDSFYFNANGTKTLRSVWRVVPAVCYNIGKFFTIGLEYNLTSAQFGNSDKYDKSTKTFTRSINEFGLATEGLHWVMNHRVQLMVKFTF